MKSTLEKINITHIQNLEMDIQALLTKSKHYNEYRNYNCPKIATKYEPLGKIQEDMVKLNLDIIKVHITRCN